MTAAAEEKPAANVVEALLRVMRDLPSIGKGGRADPKQGGYAYRAIEQVTPHTQTLFAKHGVLPVPHVQSYEVRDIVVNGKPWTDVYEMVEYTCYGPGGLDDKLTIGPLLAIGRDNSDKGGNKCLTQAMKYALVQVLQISAPVDDADGQTHEADGRPRYQESLPEQVQEFAEIWGQLSEPRKAEYLKWRNKHRIPKLPRASFEQAALAIDTARALLPQGSPGGDSDHAERVELDEPSGGQPEQGELVSDV